MWTRRREIGEETNWTWLGRFPRFSEVFVIIICHLYIEIVVYSEVCVCVCVCVHLVVTHLKSG